MPEPYKKKVLNSITAPFNAIGKLRVAFTKNTGGSVTTHATAFLIAPSYVLTAAHMLQKRGHTLLQAEVRFGDTWVEITRHAIHPGYELGHPTRDLAIGKLASRRQTKPMKLHLLGTGTRIAQGAYRIMSGFGDGAQGKLLVSRQQILEAWPNKLLGAGGPLAYATGTTTSGMSGGPVLSQSTGEVDGVISGLGIYDGRNRDVAAPLDETGTGSAAAFIQLFTAGQ